MEVKMTDLVPKLYKNHITLSFKKKIIKKLHLQTAISTYTQK